MPELQNYAPQKSLTSQITETSTKTITSKPLFIKKITQRVFRLNQKKQTTMLRYLSQFLVIISCGIHIFCCGIPLLLSISSLGIILGISGNALEIEWFEAIEDKVIIISGLVLFTTILIQKLNKKHSCNNDESCSHTNNIDFSQKLTYFALFLYCINLSIFFYSSLKGV